MGIACRKGGRIFFSCWTKFHKPVTFTRILSLLFWTHGPIPLWILIYSCRGQAFPNIAMVIRILNSERLFILRHAFIVWSKIEKIPRGIRVEKSSKDMASSRNMPCHFWKKISIEEQPDLLCKMLFFDDMYIAKVNFNWTFMYYNTRLKKSVMIDNSCRLEPCLVIEAIFENRSHVGISIVSRVMFCFSDSYY